MAEYIKFFTNYGEEKATQCIFNETDFKVSKIVIGDGNGNSYTPEKTQEELVNQRNALDITKIEINGNICRIFAEIPADNDYYIIREIGIIDDEEKLVWVSQFEMETVSNIENLVTKNIIGIQIDISQGMHVTVVDENGLVSDINFIEQVEGNSGYSLFDIVLKDHELTYEESEGFGLQGTWVYKSAVTGEHYGYEDFYNQCLAEKAEATSTATVLGSSTVATYNHANGHIYYDVTDKSTIDTYFNSTGVAWFYGIDEENERIFLPRNNYYFKGATSNAGAYVAPQLPALSHTHTGSTNSTGSHNHDKGTMNITGSIDGFHLSGSAMGAFKWTQVKKNRGEIYNANYHGEAIIDFNAKDSWSGNTSSAGSHSHTITLNSADASGALSGSTVQPPSVNGLVYIVVGNVRQKNALVINGALNDALTSISNKKTEVLGDITTAKNSATGDITTAKNSAVGDVNSAKDSAISTINGKIADASDYATAAQGSASLAQQYAELSVRGQIQTDYAQNDSSAVDFIKNKPDLTGMVKVSETQTLTNKTIDADDNTISDLTLTNFKESAIATNLTDNENISGSKIPTSQAVSLELGNIKNRVNTLIENISETVPEYGTGLSSTTALKTNVEILVSNENLTVTSSYTGVQNDAGDIVYQFTYDGSAWKDEENNSITLASYDLTLSGTPVEDDTITLVYETRYVTTVNGFDGDYTNLTNKPTNVSAFTNDAGYLTQHQDISGKADIAPEIITLNTSGTINLTDNKDYYIVPTGNIAFALPTVTDTTKKHRIEIELYLTSTYTIDWGLGNNPNYYNKTAPDLSTAGTYNILYQYSISKSAWYVGGAEIGVDS